MSSGENQVIIRMNVSRWFSGLGSILFYLLTRAYPLSNHFLYLGIILNNYVKNTLFCFSSDINLFLSNIHTLDENSDRKEDENFNSFKGNLKVYRGTKKNVLSLQLSFCQLHIGICNLDSWSAFV